MSRSTTVVLPSGRRLGIAESGPGSGRPVFFFHGFGASRLCLHPDEEICHRLGVRAISVDRPGIGLSDSAPDRKIIDWAEDIRELADQLGIARFGVLGWSAGGAFALALGAAFPDRLTSLGVISGVAPGTGQDAFGGSPILLRLAQWLTRVGPGITLAALRRVERRMRRDYPGLLTTVARQLAPSDRELMQVPEFAETLRLSAMEAFRQGAAGVAGDARAMARDWGFRLADVSCPVDLWHGAEDSVIAVGAARHNARLLASPTLHITPGDGHLLYLRRWAETLETAAMWAPADAG